MASEARFTELAAQELAELVEWELEHGGRASEHVLKRIDNLNAADFSGEGKKVRLSDGQEALCVVVGQHLIIYQVDDQGIVVLRIRHGARRPITR